jgi:hypothetical protein
MNRERSCALKPVPNLRPAQLFDFVRTEAHLAAVLGRETVRS